MATIIEIISNSKFTEIRFISILRMFACSRTNSSLRSRSSYFPMTLKTSFCSSVVSAMLITLVSVRIKKPGRRGVNPCDPARTTPCIGDLTTVSLDTIRSGGLSDPTPLPFR